VNLPAQTACYCLSLATGHASQLGGPADEVLDRLEREYQAIADSLGAWEESAQLAFLTTTSCRRLGGEDLVGALHLISL
jgi:hypothetical protein